MMSSLDGKQSGGSAYSGDTKSFLAEICEDARLAPKRKEQLLHFLSSEESNRRARPKRNSFAQYVVSQTTASENRKGNCEKVLLSKKEMLDNMLPRLRKREAIVNSGGYEREIQIPLCKKKVMTDLDKDSLAFRMAYGKDLPAASEAREALLKRVREREVAKTTQLMREMGEERRLAELTKEVEDRKRFLSLVGRQGARQYSNIIRGEIAGKLQEMERLLDSRKK